jgi:hypothetical protein
MLALKLGMLVLGASFFVLVAAVVAYDVCVATRLSRLLAQPVFHRRDPRSAQTRLAVGPTILGEKARARAVSLERQPKPLCVARLASQERRP